MNVRFFAGTKSTYLSLPKHNPQALYFCEDTQELYWGDYCLSDGIRVIPTIEDLPSLTNAADGIVYYISKTRNAYTLSPDRKSWLQTIYAPVRDASTVDESEVYNTVTTVGAVRDIEKALYKYIDKEIADIEKCDEVKAISFAGTQMLEVDGVFTIDRECALRALGIVMPEITENIAIATEAYVASEIAKIKIPDVSGFITEIPEEYITESELDAKGYLTTHQDISGKADVDHTHEQYLTELPAHTHDQYLTEHQDLSEYAKTNVINKTTIAQKYEVLPVEGMLVSYRDGEVRLNTQRVVPTKQNVGETGNSNMFYVTFRAYAPEGATGVIESDGSQTDKEPTALNKDAFGRNYTTIWSAVANYSGGQWSKWGDKSSLDKYYGFYYTFKWFKGSELIGTDKVRVILTNDTCHDDLVPDAVARRIDEKVAAIDASNIDLSEYAKKSDIPSIEGLATESYVASELAKIEIPTDYITESELEAKGYLTEHQDISGKADVNHNHDDIYETRGAAEAVKNDLLNGAGEAYDTLKELGELINENVDAIDALKQVAANKADKEHTHSQYLTEHQDISNKADKEHSHPEYITEHQSLAEYAKKSEIPTKVSAFENDKGYLTEHIDISGKADKEHTHSEYLTTLPEHTHDEYLTELPEHTHEEYLTELPEHSHDEYLTEHQDISGKADKEHTHSYNDLSDKPQIPSIEGLATEQFVKDEIANIKLPEINTNDFVTEEVFNKAITEKANEIPFSADKFITVPSGNFAVGESIKGLTLTEIITRLLGLVDEKPEDNPDAPTEPNGVIDTIINEQLSMYSVTSDGTLSADAFDIIAYTSEQAALAPEKSGFYQIVENGIVIESGYQDLTVLNDELYYVIALPKAVDYDSMVTMKIYNPDEEKWEDGLKLPLISDPTSVAALCDEAGIDISHINTEIYNIFVHEDICTGSQYRYIIKE